MLDELARPLIPTSGEPDADHEDDTTSRHTHAPADEGDIARANPFVWGLTITAGVSGLLFGYDTGVISSTLVSIRDSLSHRQLTTLDKSLITSATSFFALIASPITGFLADALGRKKTILLASGLFVIGALLQASAVTVWTMVLGRSVVGLAIGAAATVVPTYIAELAPSAFRGRLVVVLVLLITGGQVVAYIVGWALSENEAGWRWMVGLGAVPAACQLGMLGFMPETSRWLVRKGRNDEARAVLRKVFGGHGKEETIQSMVAATLYRIQEEHREEQAAVAAVDPGQGAKSSRWTSGSGIRSLHNLFVIGRNRRALAIACTLQGFQNLSGFNCLMYFSATIFSHVGFQSPILTSLSIAITNFLFTVVAYKAIDSAGRRRMLLFSIPFMALGLIVCAVTFSRIDLRPNYDAVTGTKGTDDDVSIWSVVLVVAMVLYVAAYAVGLGNVPWQQSELFPLGVRSAGSGLATTTNWACNTLVGFTFLPMMDVLTPGWTFAIYAGVCCVAWAVVFCIYPETAGLSLEEVGTLLDTGWGIEASEKRWRQNKAAGRGASGS